MHLSCDYIFILTQMLKISIVYWACSYFFPIATVKLGLYHTFKTFSIKELLNRK